MWFVLSLLTITPASANDREACAVAHRAYALALEQHARMGPFQGLVDSTCGPSTPDMAAYTLHSTTDYIRNIPPGTAILSGEGSQVDYIRNVPASVVALDLSNTPVDYIRNLPPNLVALDLSATRVDYIRNLPPSLRVLDIRGTGITTLRNLPANIACVITDLPASGQRGVIYRRSDCTHPAVRMLR